MNRPDLEGYQKGLYYLQGREIEAFKDTIHYAIEQERKAALYKELFESCEGVKHFMTMPRDYYDGDCSYEKEYRAALDRYKEAQRQLKEVPHELE